MQNMPFLNSAIPIITIALQSLFLFSCDQRDHGLQSVNSETGRIDVQLVFSVQKPAKLKEITDIWITAWPADANKGDIPVGQTQLQKVNGRGLGLLELPVYEAYQIRAVAKRGSTVVFLGVSYDIDVRVNEVSSIVIPMKLAEINGFEAVSLEPGTATFSWKSVDSDPHYQLRLFTSNGRSTVLYNGPNNRVSLPISLLTGESIRATVTNQFFPLGSGIEHIYHGIQRENRAAFTEVSISSESGSGTEIPSSAVDISTSAVAPPTHVDVYITAGTANINETIGGTSPCDQDQTSSSYIFWTDKEANKIQRANADGSNITELISGLSTPIDIALDQINEKIYFTLAAGIIEMANLDGSQVQTIVSGLAGHTFITLDIPDNQIYWSIESSPGLIQRADLYGTSIQTLISGDLGKVKYAKFISLDPISNKLFYRSNTPGNTDYLIKALHLDGTGNIESVISGQFNNGVEGIAVDSNGRKIYWAGRDSNTIYRSNIDGTGSETLITGLSDPMGIALDLVSQKIYWTDEGSKDIRKANLDGTGKETIISGLSSPNAIQVLTKCD